MLFKNSKKESCVVYTAGAAVLKEVARPVVAVTDEIRQLAADMTRAMRYFYGIGLAAPQYGHSLRMVVLDVPADGSTGTPGEEYLLPRMPVTVINPEIIARSEELSTREEGCLSVPDIYAPVVRPARVVFRAQILDGDFVEFECGGLLARCIQHEADHLDGVLFVDRLSDEVKATVADELAALQRRGKKFNFQRDIKL